MTDLTPALNLTPASALLLGLAAAHLLADALALIAKRTFQHRPGQSVTANQRLQAP